MSSTIYATAHGLNIDDAIRFADLVPVDAGPDESATYYVIADSFTTNSFKFSESKAGAAYTLYSNITSGAIYGATAYIVMDSEDVMAPPPQPQPPSAIVGAGTQSTDADGKLVTGLVVTVTQPDDPTIRTTWVKITAKLTAGGDPDWSQAMIFPIAADQTTLQIPGVLAGTTYYIIAYSQSVYGDVSPAVTYSITTPKDTTAPSLPVGLTCVADVKGFLAIWDTDPTIAPAGDLAFYEIRYCLGGSETPSEVWKSVRAKTTQVYIGGLDPLPGADGKPTAKYWVQVRAVDTTGNVLVGGVAQNYLTYPNGGWCTAVSVNPTLVGTSEVQLGSLNTTHLSGLSADIIGTGHLSISVSRSDGMDGILVYDTNAQGAKTLVGQWDETGLYVFDAANPGAGGNYVQVYAGGITVYKYGAPTTSITPDGINATSIKSGAMPGGGNVVQNSSFELADFSVPVTVTPWVDDVSADFNGDVDPYRANVNVTVSNNIQMTTTAY
jgi:hypothetical protein